MEAFIPSGSIWTSPAYRPGDVYQPPDRSGLTCAFLGSSDQLSVSAAWVWTTVPRWESVPDVASSCSPDFGGLMAIPTLKQRHRCRCA